MTNDLKPRVTIAVVTHETRLSAFDKLLSFLFPAIQAFTDSCELLVVNNSGIDHRPAVQKSIDKSNIASLCSARLVDSVENNIAVGRNTALENAHGEWLAFIDDDEYPVEQWLNNLYQTANKYESKLAAGPILPKYEDETAAWIKTIDVHNVKGLSEGDSIPFAATGNVLMHLPTIPEHRFNQAYGRTGGSDTEFFQRLTGGDNGLKMIWSESAVVYEDIPSNKSTVMYTIKRCLIQGNNYKRVLSEAGEINNTVLFHAKALLVAAGSLVVSVPLVLIKHDSAGDWVKRGFSNVGKLYNAKRNLY